MKLIFLFLIILGRDVGLAEETPTPYTTKPNTSGYPFPTAFPVLTNGRELQFDWKRYLGEAISAGDKVIEHTLHAPMGSHLRTPKWKALEILPSTP